MTHALRALAHKAVQSSKRTAWKLALELQQLPLRSRKPPRVSLITSVYKAEEYIDQLLDNTIHQTIFNDCCEWILVDVNPPGQDYEERAIRKEALEHPQIRYLRLDQDPGIYGAWNLAIEMSTAPLITNINCDDRRAPYGLEAQARLLQARPEVDLVYNDNYWVSQPNIDWQHRPARTARSHVAEFSKEAMLNFNLPHNNPMWRRSLHDRHGLFNIQYRSAADWDFWLRCVQAGSVFMKHPRTLGIYYRNPRGVSTDPANDAWKHREEAQIRQTHEVALLQAHST